MHIDDGRHRPWLSARWREVVPGCVTRHLPEHMAIRVLMSTEGDRRMAGDTQLMAWLKSECPNVWSLLNRKTQQTLPIGLVEYLSTRGQDAIDAGRKNTQEVDKQLGCLMDICRRDKVLAAYRRHISGTHTEYQVAELFCEIFLCTAFAKLPGANPRLRPASGRGTSCDVALTIADHDIYCEVKRFEDPWPTAELTSRSIFKSPACQRLSYSYRPRYMDLQSKLRDVPNQLPNDTLNILFLFHKSLGDSNEYIQQALFGEDTFLAEGANTVLREDGLFATDK